MIKEDSDLNNGVLSINDYHAYSNLRAEDRATLRNVLGKSWYSLLVLEKVPLVWVR